MFTYTKTKLYSPLFHFFFLNGTDTERETKSKSSKTWIEVGQKGRDSNKNSGEKQEHKITSLDSVFTPAERERGKTTEQTIQILQIQVTLHVSHRQLNIHRI